MGELILAKAKELFLSYGLKSVSMDDLARQAGISQKTICQFYPGKDRLGNGIVDDFVTCHTRLLHECRHNSITADKREKLLHKHLKNNHETWSHK